MAVYEAVAGNCFSITPRIIISIITPAALAMWQCPDHVRTRTPRELYYECKRDQIIIVF